MLQLCHSYLLLNSNPLLAIPSNIDQNLAFKLQQPSTTIHQSWRVGTEDIRNSRDPFERS